MRTQIFSFIKVIPGYLTRNACVSDFFFCCFFICFVLDFRRKKDIAAGRQSPKINPQGKESEEEEKWKLIN